MRTLIRTFVVFMLVALGFLASVQSANAQLRIRFEDPDQRSLPPLTISDGGPGDRDTRPGSIDISKTTYGRHSVEQVIVKSKPAIGVQAQAELDVHASVLSDVGGRLTITVADNNFSDPPEPSLILSSSSGGSLGGDGGSVRFEAWVDPGGQTPLDSAITTIPSGKAHVTIGPFASQSYSGSGTTSLPRAGLYSIFNQIQVVLSPRGSASFDQSTLSKGLHSSMSLKTLSVRPSSTVAAGKPVSITVNARNTGDTPLAGVSIIGTKCSTWTGGLAVLAPNASTNFTCTFSPNSTVDWTATVQAKDPFGVPVSSPESTVQGQIKVEQ